MNHLIMFVAALGFFPGAASGVPRPLPDPIVMMWQVAGNDLPAEFQTLKGLGINTVQSFNLSRKPPAYVEEYLRAAEATGMAVVPFVGPEMKGSGDKCNLPESGMEFIRRYRSSPSIVAWHSADEPALRKVSRKCQSRLYAQIKALDRERPVFLSTNNTTQSDYDKYFSEDAFDILDLHKYVNPQVAAPQHKLMELFRKNRKRTYPVIVTLRAFNAPGRVKRLNMRNGDLLAQYQYFFEDEPVSRNIGFYGWDLSPNMGITKIPALRSEFERLMREKVRSTK